MGACYKDGALRSTQAIIDTDALVGNVAVVRQRIGNRRLLAMVKANAYGHGMVGVSRVLEHAGVDVLGVAFVDEAVRLRESGVRMPIVVLTPFELHDCDTIAALQLDVVIADETRLRALASAASSAGCVVRCHVFVDTGMHRDGIEPSKAAAFATMVASQSHLELRGICTHLASADDPLEDYNRQQLEVFELVVQELAAMGHSVPDVHVANTGAIWNLPTSMCTMVRPGLSLYGYEPTLGRSVDLRPVMSIVTTVLSIRSVKAGDTVSYGRRWTSDLPTEIATIPIGYGDGYSRGLTGAAHVIVHGKRVPVVGTICMDECMLDVGGLDVEVGDDVVVLGRQLWHGHESAIDAVELASWANTIPYEVTTAVSSRVPRVFTGTHARIANQHMQGGNV